MTTLRLPGFALIEVLIAILVLGLGVIIAASMQLQALHTGQQSGYRTTAVQLASEIADGMRANARQMKLADPENPFLLLDYNADAEGEPSRPVKLCYANECDSAELAAFEIYEWKKRVSTDFPGGRVTICRDANPWDATSEDFRWACSAGSGVSASVVIKIGWREKVAHGERPAIAANESPPKLAVTVQPTMQ